MASMQTWWSELVQPMLRRPGLPGWCGLGLVVGAACVHWIMVPTLHEQLTHTRAQIATLRIQAKTPPVHQLSMGEALQNLNGQLASDDQRSLVLTQILDDAKTAQLSVDSLQLRMDDVGHQHLRRQVMVLPVRGSYLHIRTWLASILSAQPALSLDELELRRDQAQSEALQARVSLSLWLRAEPGANTLDQQANSVSANANAGGLSERPQALAGVDAPALKSRSWE